MSWPVAELPPSSIFWSRGLLENGMTKADHPFTFVVPLLFSYFFFPLDDNSDVGVSRKGNRVIKVNRTPGCWARTSRPEAVEFSMFFFLRKEKSKPHLTLWLLFTPFGNSPHNSMPALLSIPIKLRPDQTYLSNVRRITPQRVARLSPHFLAFGHLQGSRE